MNYILHAASLQLNVCRMTAAIFDRPSDKKNALVTLRRLYFRNDLTLQHFSVHFVSGVEATLNSGQPDRNRYVIMIPDVAQAPGCSLRPSAIRIVCRREGTCAKAVVRLLVLNESGS